MMGDQPEDECPEGGSQSAGKGNSGGGSDGYKDDGGGSKLQVVEALVKMEIVANVLRNALNEFAGKEVAARAVTDANKAADAWLAEVRGRCRAAA